MTVECVECSRHKPATKVGGTRLRKTKHEETREIAKNPVSIIEKARRRSVSRNFEKFLLPTLSSIIGAVIIAAAILLSTLIRDGRQPL